MGILNWFSGGGNSATGVELRGASFGVDGNETRSFQTISALDRAEAVRRFPDFDVAYLRAAYPTGNSGDHAAADISMVEKGLRRCVRKSLLLGRLSAYWTWQGEPVKAFCYAVHCLAATGDIEQSPSDVVGCINLLAEVFAACGEAKTSSLVNRLNPGYDESPDMQRRIAKIAGELASRRHRETVAWGSGVIASKFGG